MKKAASRMVLLLTGLWWLPVSAQPLQGAMNMSMIRHHHVMQHGIDPQYESRVNPLAGAPQDVAAGGKLYAAHCSACHGATGLGDGPAAAGLDPPPANIAMFLKMHRVPDGYLYWTLAEGGVPLQTAMPPFKETLTEEQIWRTILFLRGL
jgi:mono/diheme cytochrome c family protein